MNTDVKRIQDKLLEMGVAVAEILEQNNIPYMLSYGTLLGAMRHKGFIPWDDDFDFILFDDSYDRAIELLRKNLPESMLLEDEKSEPLYFHAWAHVKDRNSKVECKEFPQDSLYTCKGVCLDLYKGKKLPYNELDDYINAENRAYITRRKEKGLISEEDYQARMHKLMLNEKQKRYVDVEKNEDVLCVVTDVMHMEDIFPLKKYVYENAYFYGPANADKILKDLYGDYMQLPPEEERIIHYDTVEFYD